MARSFREEPLKSSKSSASRGEGGGSTVCSMQYENSAVMKVMH
jgi:hypothetical protein